MVRSGAILRRTRPNATCIIAPLTCGYLIAFQNFYNATLFFRFGIRNRTNFQRRCEFTEHHHEMKWNDAQEVHSEKNEKNY